MAIIKIVDFREITLKKTHLKDFPKNVPLYVAIIILTKSIHISGKQKRSQ